MKHKTKLSRGKKIVRFGVIGAGGMGQKYCRIIKAMPRASLAAICDVDAGAAGKAGAQFGAPFFCSHRDLIRAKCCDAVAIVTPHPFHCQPAVDCMNAGLHVITEKPLTERVATADRMIKAARANQVAFAVMFQMRLDPVWRRALEIARAGKIGRIYRTAMLEMKYRTQRYYDSGTWRATWKGEGGGVLINQAPHLMDMFVQLCGVPGEIFGRTETRLHRIEVEDWAEALLKYKNGASGYLYCSTVEAGPGSMIEIFGDKGKLVIRDGKLELYRFKTPIVRHIRESAEIWEEVETLRVELPAESGRKIKTGHEGVLENFVSHILDGARLATSGESGLGSLELANAIALSARAGKWVKMPISRKRYDELLFRLQRESKFVKRNVRVERKTDPRLA